MNEKVLCQCGCGKELTPIIDGPRKGLFPTHARGHFCRRSNLERLEKHCYYDPNSGCILYAGHEAKGGYGLFKFRNGNSVKSMVAHRAAWLIAGKTIPHGMKLLHKCDVRCCVNLEHLFVGTQRENVYDMAKKGRGNRNSLAYGVHRSSVNTYSAQVKPPGDKYRYFGTYRSIEQAAAVAALVKAVAYGLSGLASPPVAPPPALA